ncbi:DNA topoisomerase VI subunit B [Pseudobacteriovorax antillogorgiicola]|uniref:DNA topoisomerase-6 subunit B n=1 Tax=Pseudobacteriovorax antillogorgiicola TaxID=1513793 RepID=A0A1Y6BWY3_9BACT|nr:DNA topoisomerase VI subunit B [Pseudobacteriovorax antillogorgiicola]TCS52365.1 DNA topoisomerase-6 subunit B [Pseudobacteriovorax antillogorgiicola]SMF29420.1 DNA topoisomerase-6 subunit B [Pseudobacteriovorax antillogorgiicola]
MASKDSKKGTIRASSTAEYFAKNLQQVGFSSPTKAVLTTLKEAVDNSLDACEENGILPEIRVTIDKKGRGSLRNTDQIMIRVEDNGPGIQQRDVAKVFGEYLASSKFGKGRCSRGQQGIGISAATTWAMQTTAKGVHVITKTAKQKLATSCRVQVDLKHNKGHIKDKKDVKWDRPHGTLVEFLIDGRVQMNGEAGILAFLRSNVLVNPHLTLSYQILDQKPVTIERVSEDVPRIPEAMAPHPHTMKLGEFLAHARLFGKISAYEWLKTAFSRVNEESIKLLKQAGVKKSLLDKSLHELKEADFKNLFIKIQDTELKPPSTKTVLSIGEEGLAKSILRLGDVDYFSVLTRKPTICDFKPVQIEVALARLSGKPGEGEETVQVLRFANRVPLQFDKASCAIVKGITSVNWKPYGLRQARGSLPYGPYIVAVSLVSPFIKFKNASKETVDASDELVEEIRRALMQAGQRLGRHLRREHKEAILENKIQHIESFAPILVEGLVRITESDESRKDRAHKGLLKILGRETREAEKDLEVAEDKLKKHLKSRRKRLGHVALMLEKDEALEASEKENGEAESGELDDSLEDSTQADRVKKKKSAKKKAAKAAKKRAEKKKAPKKAAKKKAAKKTAKKKAVKKKAAKKTAKKKAVKKKAAKKVSTSKKTAKKKAAKKKSTKAAKKTAKKRAIKNKSVKKKR